MSLYGDFVVEDDPKGLPDLALLLAEQITKTVELLYPEGKWPTGIVQARLGWTLQEVSQSDLA